MLIKPITRGVGTITIFDTVPEPIFNSTCSSYMIIRIVTKSFRSRPIQSLHPLHYQVLDSRTSFPVHMS